jgi:hypothetical protein
LSRYPYSYVFIVHVSIASRCDGIYVYTVKFEAELFSLMSANNSRNLSICENGFTILRNVSAEGFSSSRSWTEFRSLACGGKKLRFRWGFLLSSPTRKAIIQSCIKASKSSEHPRVINGPPAGPPLVASAFAANNQQYAGCPRAMRALFFPLVV